MAEAKATRKARIVGVDPQDFSPSQLRVQTQHLAPFARALLRLLLFLLFLLILWATFGKLDIVATAEGKLIPQTYLKIIQPNTQRGAGQSAPPSNSNKPGTNQPFTYRALIDLKAQELLVKGVRHTLNPGMQVTAEIHLGTRAILEYLLSPVMGAFQEAGREQ